MSTELLILDLTAEELRAKFGAAARGIKLEHLRYIITRWGRDDAGKIHYASPEPALDELLMLWITLIL